MRVIALTGLKGCGKDTVGIFMKELYGEDVETIAFADPIKAQIIHIFNLNGTEAYDAFKRCDLSYTANEATYAVPGRHVVREVGMLMRSYCKSQFVEYVRKQIESKPNKIWVITDLRFDNEFEMVKSLSGIVVKVANNRLSNTDEHITEKGFNDNVIDYVIPNHGTKNMLLINLKSFIQTLKETNETWSSIQA